MRILLVENYIQDGSPSAASAAETASDSGIIVKVKGVANGLAGAGFAIDEASTLADAKLAIAGHDAVICDLGLPGSTPIEIMDWLASLESPRLVYTITDDLTLARELGRRHLQFIRKSRLTAEDLLFTLNWSAGAHEDFLERERRRRADSRHLSEIRRILEAANDGLEAANDGDHTETTCQ